MKPLPGGQCPPYTRFLYRGLRVVVRVALTEEIARLLTLSLTGGLSCDKIRVRWTDSGLPCFVFIEVLDWEVARSHPHFPAHGPTEPVKMQATLILPYFSQRLWYSIALNLCPSLLGSAARLVRPVNFRPCSASLSSAIFTPFARRVAVQIGGNATPNRRRRFY